MENLILLVHLFELLLYVYLAGATVYIAFFGLASLLPMHHVKKTDSKLRKFAVLIPGYKEDNVIVDVARQATKQNYPSDHFEVIVIADSFQQTTIDQLKAIPVRVVEVVFEVSKKSKALNRCMKVIGDAYDVAMILDADNVMEQGVLYQMNEAFNHGFLAVQGHRMAKNLNTDFAILDAISEEINNKIFRKGHRVLGFSSALIGSGMAIDYGLFKQYMAEVDSVGEDKELEMLLLKNRFKIEYLEGARVYDEKTSKKEVFVNQRRRWIAAQLEFFRKYFFDGLWHLIRFGNVDYFDKVLQMIQPPRILLFGALLIITLFQAVMAFIFPETWASAIPIPLWFVALMITFFTLVVTTPLKFYRFRTAKALLSLPTGFILMIKSLLKVKGASKRFIHTTHGHTDTKNPH